MTEPAVFRRRAVAVSALALAVWLPGCGGDTTGPGAGVDGSADEDAGDRHNHSSDGGSFAEAPTFHADAFPELALWLDADDDDTLTLTAGGRVAVWNDKSNRENHAYQGTERLMPAFAPNARAGRAAVQFDGSYLTTSDLIQLRATLAGYTVFAVAKNTVADGVEGTAGRGGILLGSFGRTEPNVGIELHHDRRLRHWWDRRDGHDQPADGNRGDAIVAEPRPARGAYAMLLFTLDAEAGLAGGGVDGVLGDEQPDDGPTYEVRTPLRVGADYREGPLSVAWEGAIAEILVFERLLSADELAELQAYLSRKWNIPVDGA